ncbi:MAG: hypothetical protein AB1347_07640 [Acidobacteriota bacterium]
MKALQTVIMAVAVALSWTCPQLAAGGKDAPLPPVVVPAHPESSLTRSLLRHYTKAQLQAGTYVGSEFCIACHGDKAGWRDSKHAQALRRPLAQYSLVAGKGIVADYDQNGMDDFAQGLDFNSISSVFDAYKPNAPVLGFSAGTYQVTIGQVAMPVLFTQGGTGDWKQRFVLRIPVSDTLDGLSVENYVSPVQYQEKTHEYVLYNVSAWYDGSKQPKILPGMTSTQVAALNTNTFSKKCIGCHTTGQRDIGQNAAGEWFYKGYPAVLYDENDPSYFDYDHDGLAEIVNVGCEACHGPGSRHILAGGDPTKIFMPEDDQVCAQCHVRVKSVPNGTFEWAMKDDTRTPWIPGVSTDPVESFYSNAAGYWPDGMHPKQHHQQYHDLMLSAHKTNPYLKLNCFTCHDPHGPTTNAHQLVTSIQSGGLVIPTSNDNDTLCLACHATHGPFASITKQQVLDYAANRQTIGDTVAAHSRHYYNPEGAIGVSRCSACHMPKVAVTAYAYDISAHTFEPVAPEKTLAYQPQAGMPNACQASCHQGRPLNFSRSVLQSDDFGKWNEALDVSTAEILLHAYGPGGIWWDTSQPTSMANSSRRLSNPPDKPLPPVLNPLDD